MTRYLFRVCVAVLSIAIGVLEARAQDTEIRSVRFRAEPVTSPHVSATVENLRDSALLAWRIELSPGASIESNFLGGLPFPYSAGHGPIPAHQTRTLSVNIPGSDGQTESRVAAAIFADGYFEGSPADLDRCFREIRARTEELTYWRDALSKAPTGSSREITAYMHARIAERAARSPSDPLRLGSNLSSALQGPRPDWWASRVVERYSDDVGAALRAVSVRFTPAPAGALPSVTVRTAAVASTDYTLYIENLREVSIEAWSIQTVRSPDGRATGDHASDACIGDPALESPGRSRGRIRPNEVRAEHIPISPNGNEPPPIRLTMVLFEDLSFEGSASDRDDTLRRREHLADEKSYWIQAFKEAAAVPAGNVATYLQNKRAERSAQNAVAGRGFGTHEVDEALAALERSPQMFHGWLSMRLSMLEGEFARLSRHLKD